MATGQMCTQGSQPGFRDLFRGFHMPQKKQMKPVHLIPKGLSSFPGVLRYPNRILRATLQLPEFLTSSHHSPAPRILHTKSQPFSSQNSLTQAPAHQLPESFTPNHCPPAPRIPHTKSLFSTAPSTLYIKSCPPTPRIPHIQSCLPTPRGPSHKVPAHSALMRIPVHFSFLKLFLFVRACV